MSRVKSLVRSRVALWTAGWVGLYIGCAAYGFVRVAEYERTRS